MKAMRVSGMVQWHSVHVVALWRGVPQQKYRDRKILKVPGTAQNTLLAKILKQSDALPLLYLHFVIAYVLSHANLKCHNARTTLSPRSNYIVQDLTYFFI